MSDLPAIATLAAVSAGCAIGAVARFEVSRRIVQRVGDSFPWGTLVVNVTGCMSAGALLASPGASASPVWVAFLGAGILGGYTTVSSFGLETALMFRRGHASGALAYVGASMFGCVAATGLGAALVLWLTG